MPPLTPVSILDLTEKATPEATDRIPLWDATAAATKQTLLSAIAGANKRIIRPAQLSAHTNDYNPTGLSTADVVLLDTDNTGLKISGIQGGVDGRVLWIGGEAVYLCGDDANSSAANRFDFGPFLGSVHKNHDELLGIIYDGTRSRWRLLAGLPSLAHYIPRYELRWHDDFENYQEVVSGTGASATERGSWGGRHIDLDTGTTSTGAAGAGTNSLDIFGEVGGVMRGAFQVPASLSDGTNRYTLRIGLLDSLTGDPVDGAYLRYCDNVNSGKFEGVCRTNSTETAGDTGVTVEAGAHYQFAIVLRDARGEADFYVQKWVSTVGLGRKATVAGIPGSGRYYGMGASMVKSLGATSRYARVYNMVFEPTNE